LPRDSADLGFDEVRPRVLVVDDEPALRRLLARMLSHDCEVVTPTSATEALALVQRGERFDVILCDTGMPDVPAASFLERLRRLSPELAARVAFVTGATALPESLAFLRSVPNRHVRKPFGRGELQELVDAMLLRPRVAAALD
jgi:CheY-like chemotaxis protein